MKKVFLSFVIIFSFVFFISGCKNDDSSSYYSLTELYKEIDEDPSGIVNSDSETSKYVSFKGSVSELNPDEFTFVVSNDDYELFCYFADDSIASEFFETYQENDTVYLTGQIIKNNNEYQAVITKLGK